MSYQKKLPECKEKLGSIGYVNMIPACTYAGEDLGRGQLCINCPEEIRQAQKERYGDNQHTQEEIDRYNATDYSPVRLLPGVEAKLMKLDKK